MRKTKGKPKNQSRKNQKIVNKLLIKIFLTLTRILKVKLMCIFKNNVENTIVI